MSIELIQKLCTIAMFACGFCAAIAYARAVHVQNRALNVPPILTSDETKAVTDRALKIAAQYGSFKTTLEHLALAVIEDRQSSSAQLLIRAGINLDTLRSRVRNVIPAPNLKVKRAYFTPEVLVVLGSATRDAFQARAEAVYPAHVLAAVLKERNSKAARALQEGGVTLELVQGILTGDGARPELESTRHSASLKDQSDATSST
ncbi:MAG: Clp protease N-terminal domain-containing protein [Gemmatimonas sp.]